MRMMKRKEEEKPGTGSNRRERKFSVSLLLPSSFRSLFWGNLKSNQMREGGNASKKITRAKELIFCLLF